MSKNKSECISVRRPQFDDYTLSDGTVVEMNTYFDLSRI